ncbi:MAG: plastocyanin/azurin family copper-binding protein [Byssovorax sp.]
MRQIWFGLLAIAGGASLVSVGCGGDTTTSGTTSTGSDSTASSTSAASSSTSGGGGAGGSGGAATTSTTSAGGATATSSATTAASSSSTGGGCTKPADCPKDPTSECTMATCDQGTCGLADVAADTPTATQAKGDCQKTLCDGQGNTKMVADNTDLPDDSKACTNDVCTAGVPSHTSLAAGSACAEGTGKFCDGAGVCAECITNADCATGLCSAGVCSMVNGCAPATATDLTALNSTTINFGGAFGLNYVPKCIKVKAGSKVVFDGIAVGSFASHPFVGGEVKNGVKIQAASGPFMTLEKDPTISSKTYTMTTVGTFPYYCDFHALAGMTGAVFVQ